MEQTAALLRSNQIKKRLAGVTTLLELLTAQRDPLTHDAEYLAALLPDVLPCLRDHNFRVAMTALEILEVLLPRVPDTTTRSFFKVMWTSLVERLGDSKLQVREKAVDVVVLLTQLLGVSAVFERLRPCVAHKNWRAREQTIHALWRCLEAHELFTSMKGEVLDDIVRLLEDSAKEVRESAMCALEKFYAHIGPSLMYDLESKSIRGGQMRILTEKFSGAAPNGQRPVEIKSSFAASTSTEPMSSTARFLSAIKNKEYNFDTMTSTTMAPVINDTAAVRSPSQASSTSTYSGKDSDGAATLPFPAIAAISDRDIQREFTKIADGLRLSNDWSIRVEALKSLQRLALKCDKGGNGITCLSQGIRSVRESVCEQVADLRSSVSREACQTLLTLAKVMKDDFNPHAEYCIGNLMKATYVTILVISTAADTSVRGIIECTKNGYSRMINKFIDGAKTRNQVLRLNSVAYLTLTLERWSPAFISKHVEMIMLVLPALLHDALAEVRAQARKCYWAFHRLFPQEAEDLSDRLDPSTQKNLRDDPARDKKLEIVDDLTPSVGPTSRFSLKRELQKSASEPSITITVDPIPASSAPSRVLPAPVNDSASIPNSAVKVTSASSLGARRVLGTGASLQSADSESRPLQSASRVLSQGPLRVGFGAKGPLTEDEGAAGSSKAVAGPLRVLKASDSAFRQDLPPVPRAQRVQVASELFAQGAVGGDATVGGPVPRKDRANGPKRRAVAPDPTSPAEESTSRQTAPIDPPSKPVNASSREPPTASRSSRSVPPPPSQEGFDEALVRIENGLWSVRLEAMELIERTLEKSRPSTIGTQTMTTHSGGKEKKMDERILLALVRHLTDPHYRVAQAALKSLHSCLSVASQQQVAPFLKTILPKLFQKFVDPKESTRTIAREILELFVSNYEASLLVGYVIQQLTDGSNMKMKAAVCHYLKELLPGARDYIQQGSNNSSMRGLLTKIAQLLEGDAPVAVTSACGDVLQVTSSLFAAEVESSMPLLAPTKRSTLTRVLRSRGIILSVGQSNSLSTNSSGSQVAPAGSEREVAPSNQRGEDKTVISRKRQAQSPLKLSSSPVVTHKKESEQLSPVIVADISKLGLKSTPEGRIDYAKLSSLSDFASMISSAAAKTPSERFEELLAVLGNNNSTDIERIAAFHKMNGFIKAEPEEFWEKYFPRVLSLLLESASERDVNAIRVLQRLLRAQPHRAEEFFHPVLLGLFDSINGHVDLAAHMAELTLTEVVRSSIQTNRVLELLLPLVSTRDPPVLQVALQLVREALDSVSKRSRHVKTPILPRSSDWSAKLLSPLVAKLHHSSSDVRKRTVDCLVAYHFANQEDETVTNYLAQHLDVTKQKLVDIFIQRRRSDLNRSGLDTTME